MAKIYTKNDSNKHLVVDSLTVLRKIKGGGITQIQDNIENLRKAHQTLAQQTENYWTELAADNVINPEEKKILYKEWKLIESEYVALLEEATASGLIDSSQALIDYKNNYEALYSYLMATLKVFDNMKTATELTNRELFIKKYDDYYTSRDKLRNAIKDGELSDLDTAIQGQIDNIQTQLEDITQGGVADGSITVDKLASDIRDNITQFEDAAATGFLTDDILQAIDTSVTASSDEINAKITKNESDSKLYLQLMADRLNMIIDDAKRVTRSHLKQTSDSITLSVVNLAEETATQLKLTDEAITAMATNLREETSAALKITSNRITNMVTGGSSEAYLSLSVGIPYYITLTKYEEWEKLLAADATGLQYLQNIYVKTNVGTDKEPAYYYVMKADATQTEIKTLTNKLRALDNLSSQVIIDADMVQVNGETIFSADNTIKQSYINYSGYATDQSVADVDKKADNAQSTADEAVTQTNNFIDALLDDNAIFDGTVISGGFIKTGLLDVDKIFAKDVIAKNKIASDNFYDGNKDPTGKGFLIDCKTGDMTANMGTFNNIVIKENSVFGGDIYSGPLVLNSDNPSEIEDVLKYKAGEITKEFYEYALAHNWYGLQSVNGTYAGKPFVYIKFWDEIWGGAGGHPAEIYFYDKDMREIAWHALYDSNGGDYPYGNYFVWYRDVEIGFYNPKGKTFKLLSLPTNEPNQPGAIWVDAAGYLRIKKEEI